MKADILHKITEIHPTPAYVFDLDALNQRMQMIRETLGDSISLCYAMKANPFLIGPMQMLVDKFEVCSPGEFAICEREKIPMEDIVLSGVYKEEKEIARIVTAYHGKGTFTIESLQQFRLLKACAMKQKKNLKLLIRLTSGNQFGVAEETLIEIVKDCKSCSYLEFRGIQLYSGTQKKKLGKIQEELIHLDELCKRIQGEAAVIVKEIEYGPGFYVPYFQNEEDADDKAMLQEFKAMLQGMKFQGKITLEMGRFFVAYCGYYATTIVDQKKNGEQNYSIVDGGIHHLNYYGQTMAMKLPHVQHLTKSSSQEFEKWNICGSLCTVGDVIVKQLPLQGGAINDILVFERVGAYSITEGIYLFLSRDLPKVIFYSQKKGAEVVREAAPTNLINSVQKKEK